MSIITIFLAMVFVGIVITFIFEMVLKTNKSFRKRYYKNHKLFFGYHVHHSTYGLVLMIISVVLFLLDKNIFSLTTTGIGTGIIIMHTISDGRFVFIEIERTGGHY